MLNLTLVAYIVCAAAYLFLSIVLLIGWRGKKEGGILLLASVITFVWAMSGMLIAVSDNRLSGLFVAISLIIEGIRNTAVLAFLVILLKKVVVPTVGGEPGKLTPYYKTVCTLVVAVCGYSIGADLLTGFTKYIVSVTPSISGHLAISVLGLALLEQLYRNTAQEKRWGIRYISLAFAGIFIYEFYLYADSLLFSRIEAGIWGARPWIVAFVSPLIAVSAARNPKWSLDVYVSRQAVFHTATLISAGIYLLLMSIAGFYIKKYGGDWGAIAQAVFVFAAVMLLLLIVLSGKIRSWLKVTLNKHFFNYKYDYRQEWIRFNTTLTALDDIVPIKSRAIKSLAQIVESPAGLLFAKNQDGDYQLAANWNTPLPSIDVIGKGESLLQFVIDKEWVIDLQEFKQNGTENNKDGKYIGLKLNDDLLQEEYRFIIPLINDAGLYGFIILNEPRSKLTLNWEDMDVLKTAGSQIASYLAQYDANTQLTIARQFEAYNRLSTFVIHDLKNLVGQLSLLCSNSKKFRHNEEFIDDAFETVENSVAKMNHLLEQLRSGIEKKVVGRVEVKALLNGIVNSRKSSGKKIELAGDSCEYYINADKQELIAVIEHILQNAIDATAKQKENALVEIELKPEVENIIVKIKDNGEGMSREFIRDRLFSPFDTTKGDSGMGVGVYQAREYISKIGGRIEVNSEVGIGTVFELFLPLSEINEEQ